MTCKAYPFKRLCYSGLSCLQGFAWSAHAAPINSQTLFDEAPWVSARAAGMAEAVSPIANGMEAPYYNPAAIGGLAFKQERPVVTQLYVPYAGVALNRSSQELNQQLSSGANIHDSAVADELLTAFSGEHPYGRISLMPAITFYRVFLAMNFDMRVASTPNAAQADVIDVNSRTQSGPVLGFSLGSPKRDWYLGVSAAWLKRTITEGSFPLADINEATDRRRVFQQAQRHFQGLPVNLGLLWNGSYRWRPALSLVAHNLSGTTYKVKEPDTPNHKVAEEVTVGFALSPNIGNLGMLSLVLEGGNLTKSTINLANSLRAGAEFTIGNAFGAEAGFSARIGYRLAGPSFGLGLNFGIIGVQVASFSEDIGDSGNHVIERRSVVNLGFNIADF